MRDLNVNSRLWIIGDTHWFHDNIVTKHKIRPVDHMDLVINNWKRMIHPNNIVVHLGDVILKYSRENELKNIMDSLPGYKILVRGNHDHHTDFWYMNHGFQFCCDEFKHGNFIFSHRPVPFVPNGFINVFGHCHIEISENMKMDINRYRQFSLEFEMFNPRLIGKFIATTRNLNYYTKRKEVYSEWLRKNLKNQNQ